MKILHLTSARSWRGGENQLSLLVSNLPASIQSIIVAPRGSALLAALPSSFATAEMSCGGAFDMKSVLGVHRLCVKENIDLIHAHTSKANEVALLARVGTSIPLVVSRKVAFPVSGGWKYRRADHIIAVSAAAAAGLYEAGVDPDKVTVIHDAVDTRKLEVAHPKREGASDEDVIVLCAAAFTREKDHQLLLDAWRMVERSAPRARLYLAGDGVLRDDIAAGIATRGLSRVRMLGWRDDIMDILQGADIVTLSSTQEGLASILCEAQMAGKPVAATRVGGVPEAVIDGVTGLLSRVSEAPALARNLLTLISDDPLRAKLGAQGRRHARQNFDPMQTARRHADVYSALAKPAA